MFTQRGVALLNLGPDSQRAFRRYWQTHEMPFSGLADPEHRVAVSYRQPVRLLKLGRLPMQIIVDSEGVIRYRYESSSMSDIPKTAVLLAALDQL
ncbi:MAG: redoxin domain-containing protein [Deltaproteobacteria bacterium]|nr:redoxin domain-containing protein [Deltaproteobacteria bacterium]